MQSNQYVVCKFICIHTISDFTYDTIVEFTENILGIPSTTYSTMQGNDIFLKKNPNFCVFTIR